MMTFRHIKRCEGADTDLKLRTSPSNRRGGYRGERCHLSTALNKRELHALDRDVIGAVRHSFDRDSPFGSWSVWTLQGERECSTALVTLGCAACYRYPPGPPPRIPPGRFHKLTMGFGRGSATQSEELDDRTNLGRTPDSECVCRPTGRSSLRSAPATGFSSCSDNSILSSLYADTSPPLINNVLGACRHSRIAILPPPDGRRERRVPRGDDEDQDATLPS
ncbi:hypothetical protein AAG570_005423 [Ranatra chinensis]|uniref:Uncharacterized protein n=1 Tax=Ranatra chinensis TaxID=642074 RepID=A0ABD0XXQ4_9HEMI